MSLSVAAAWKNGGWSNCPPVTSTRRRWNTSLCIIHSLSASTPPRLLKKICQRRLGFHFFFSPHMHCVFPSTHVLVCFSLHRSVHGGSVCQAGEHAPELAVRQHPAHGHRGSVGLLSSAPPTLLPAQHQHGLPAKCQVTDPGTVQPVTPGTPSASFPLEHHCTSRHRSCRAQCLWRQRSVSCF